MSAAEFEDWVAFYTIESDAAKQAAEKQSEAGPSEDV